MNFSEIELPSNKKFGRFFTFLFAIAAGLLYANGSTGLACLFVSLSAVIFATTLAKPDLLLPLNAFWMWLGRLLAVIVSPIILGIVFFCLITPIALITRICGRDELRIKRMNRKSYWISRDEPIAPDSFDRQF